MIHNLETVKLKLRAYNTHRGRLEDVFKELEALEKELREMKASHSSKLMVNLHTVLNDILGKKELKQNV